jgi:hypothetical protein
MVGSHWVRVFLTQAAWAAAHTKATFSGRKFFTLAARIGRKQALITILDISGVKNGPHEHARIVKGLGCSSHTDKPKG